jgi:HD superfamily phosphohydrolase
MPIMNAQKSMRTAPVQLETPYGTFEIKEPVLIDLINSPSMQRLKYINQYGITAYATDIASFSRYDHSIGVFVLLRKFNIPLHEQIAGLLHDVSHTVFSHIGDLIFNHVSEKNSYQDDIHEWFIQKTELAEILARHGFLVKDILHKQKKFQALEQDLPHLCADRLEYNIRGALVEKHINQDDVDALLQALQFADGKWFFTEVDQAKKLAFASLYLQQFVYTSPANCLMNFWTGQALRRALAIDLISMDDIHFSVDDRVLEKLKKSNDHIIMDLLDKIFNQQHLIGKGTFDAHDFHFALKFRGINPFVLVKNKLQLLTELDEGYLIYFQKVKTCTREGWYISLKSKT